MALIDFADKYQINDSRVPSLGIVAHYISCLEIAQLIDDSVDYPVNSEHLTDHGPDIRK